MLLKWKSKAGATQIWAENSFGRISEMGAEKTQKTLCHAPSQSAQDMKVEELGRLYPLGEWNDPITGLGNLALYPSSFRGNLRTCMERDNLNLKDCSHLHYHRQLWGGSFSFFWLKKQLHPPFQTFYSRLLLKCVCGQDCRIPASIFAQSCVICSKHLNQQVH